MKKNLKLALLLLPMLLYFSCTKENNEIVDKTIILGSWSETKLIEEDYLSMTMEIIWTFNENNTASQEIILRLNNSIYKDITNNYSYNYDGSHITFTDKNSKVWTYEIQVSNNNMKLGNEEDGYFNLTKIEMNDKQSNNEIRYTTTSNTIIYPYENKAFNANIISNTIVDKTGILTFSKDLETIGDNAFRGIYELKSISLPTSIENIGEYAFYKCENLIECKLANKVSYLGNSAFKDCTNLSYIEIPNNLNTIKQGAFYNCKSLKHITLPASLRIIENGAFAYCENLENIEIPNNVTELGSMAFCGCNTITSISIPESITVINGFTFSSCNNLVKIILPKSITDIKENAFYESKKLECIYCYSEEPPHITKGTESGTGTFNGFSKTTKIFVPKTSIDKYKEQWHEVVSQIYSII